MDSPDTQNAPESKLHFLDYWRIIRIRKAIIISVFLITTIIATAVTFLMTPSYSSTAQIKIEPDNISDVPTATAQGNAAPYDPYFMETELKAIQGEDVLSGVVGTLHLDTKWGKTMSPDGQPLKVNDAIDFLRRFITAEPERNTKIINVTVFNEDKELAATIANSIADSYKDYRLEQHRLQVAGGIKVLKDQFAEQEAELSTMQSNVDMMAGTLGIVVTDPFNLNPTPTITADQLQHFSQLYIEGQATYVKLDKQFSELLQVQATNPVALRDVLPTIQSDSELSDMLGKLHENQQKYVAETNFATAQTPDIASTLSLITELNSEIDHRINGIMIGLQENVESQKAALDELKAKVEEAKNNSQAETIRAQPYWEAKTQLQSKQELHRLLAARIESDEADSAIPKTTLVTLINPATPALTPDRPRKTLNICFGAFSGLLVGLLLAFFIEYLDTSVKTIDEVERVFQAPVLGVIPQNVGLLMDEGVDGSHAEAYRVLRTNILFSRKDDGLNTIVVVSAGMGEGKSTTALNLSTVFAQAGQRTLLVDSDLRRPSLHKLLRLSNNTGLVNYLLKQNPLEQVIQTTAVPMLDFLASGKLPGGNMNILGSAQMKDLITELKLRYDFIIFDSPPIMGLSDAAVLASEVDMAIQVIQYRRYPQLMSIRAKQMVEKVGGNLVGIVLNNINMAQDESYYYYGGYYYHNSEDSRETTSKRSSGDRPSGDSGGVGIEQKY